jgi:hypothetical protein
MKSLRWQIGEGLEADTRWKTVFSFEVTSVADEEGT